MRAESIVVGLIIPAAVVEEKHRELLKTRAMKALRKRIVGHLKFVEAPVSITQPKTFESDVVFRMVKCGKTWLLRKEGVRKEEE